MTGHPRVAFSTRRRRWRDAVGRFVADRKTPGVGVLVALLLVADLTLIALHLGNRVLDVSDALFLDVDHGYGEFIQYLKFLWLIVLTVWVGRTQRRWRLAGWAAIFGYLLLDDALQLHERLGRLLTDLWSPDVHQPDATLGEFVGVALPLLVCVVWAWLLQREPGRQARAEHRAIIALLALLAFFGVVVDALHGLLAYSTQPGDLVAIIEDGGEHIVVSLLVGLMFGLLVGGNSHRRGLDVAPRRWERVSAISPGRP